MRSVRGSWWWLAVLAIPLLTSCNSGGDDDPLPDRYEAAVKRAMDRYKAPGVVAAVWRPGKEPWKQGFGYADVESKRPSDVRDHFSIRSITKSFTVTVILQLAQDGALSLDHTIDRYVAGIPNGNRITLTQLAAMESGIKNYSETLAFQDAIGKDISRSFTEAELIGYAIPLSPVFDPAARYNYSNTNTVLLGMVVESVTKTPLAEVMRARIFEPLHLSRTTYPVTTPLPDPHPTPYVVDPRTDEMEAVPLLSPTGLAGAGAMVSTIDDLGAWGQALGTGRLLSPALFAFRLAHSRTATDGPIYDRYGLGIGSFKGWWGHTGTGFGFQAAVFYDPSSGSTIAVLVNATPISPDMGDEDNIAQDVFAELADVVNAR